MVRGKSDRRSGLDGRKYGLGDRKSSRDGWRLPEPG